MNDPNVRVVDGPEDDAPWGRRADGSPRNKPGPPKGTAGRSRPPRRKPAPRPRAASAKGPDYRPAVAGLLQLPAFGLTMVGKFTGNRVFLADAAAVTIHAPNVADAAHQTAMSQPGFAAVLDKVLQVGPWGALLGAGLPLAFQIAANHGAVPASPEMGILPAEDLLNAVSAMAA